MSNTMTPSKKTSLPNSFPTMKESGKEDSVQERKTSLPGKHLSAAKTSTIIEDSKSYKIVLDVLGYSDDQLSVTILNSNAVLIEGVSETHTERKIFKKSLRKPYQVPSNVDIYSGVCVLSSEGTLTLTLPKLSYSSNEISEDYILDPRLQPAGTVIKINDKSKRNFQTPND